MPAFIDYTGKTIGRLYINGIHSEKGKGFWDCTCQCGMRICKTSSYLRNGKSFECETCRLERTRVNLIGKVVSRWTILGRAPNDSRNKTMYFCRCECGIERAVSADSFHKTLRGHSRHSMSCGCLGRKLKSKYVNDSMFPPAHGFSTSNLYAIRVRISQSCYNPKHPQYKDYGAQGYTLCELWKNGAKDFCECAIKNGWKKSHVIAIKDGFKEYCPENCYIVDESTYISETRKKRIIVNGVERTVGEICDEIGISKNALRIRLKRYDLATALKLKSHQNSGRKFSIDKEEVKKLYVEGKLSKRQIAQKLKISLNTITSRLKENGIIPENGSNRRDYGHGNCTSCGKEFKKFSSNHRKCIGCAT